MKMIGMKTLVKTLCLTIVLLCSQTVAAQQNLLADCTSVADSVATIQAFIQQNESKFIGHKAIELFLQINNSLFVINDVVPLDTGYWSDPNGESYVEGVCISPYDEADAYHRLRNSIPYLEINVYFEEPFETWDGYVERVPDNAFGRRELAFSNEKIVKKVEARVVKFDDVPENLLW
jgi:hypothetical protein